MLTLLRFILPLIVLILTSVAFWFFQTQAPTQPRTSVEKRLPVAQVTDVSPQKARIPLISQGIIQPIEEVGLTSHIAGEITWYSKQLQTGKKVKKGDILVKIDPGALEQQLSRARSQRLLAEQKLKTLKAEYATERRLSQRLNQQHIDRGMSSPLEAPEGVYQQQLVEAQSQLDSSALDVQHLQQQLKHTEIFAPFDGRVRAAFFSTGHPISPGMEIARLYATDMARIRIPLTDRQWALLPAKLSELPAIKLLSQKKQRYQASNCHAEGTIDPSNQLRYLICDVPKAFHDGPALDVNELTWAGQWVEVTIMSREFDHLIQLPRLAVFKDQWVWQVDEQQRLRKQKIEILHKSEHSVYAQLDWPFGRRLLVQPLSYHIENMQVTPVQPFQQLDEPRHD